MGALGVVDPHSRRADIVHPRHLHPLFRPVGVEGGGLHLSHQGVGHPVHEGKLLKFQCNDLIVKTKRNNRVTNIVYCEVGTEEKRQLF